MSYKTEAEQVRRMFASIAGRYDKANDILSLGMHHWWRRCLCREMRPCSVTLDVASGTGALVPYLLKKSERVVATDFCEEMLREMPRELLEDPRVSSSCADAMGLEFADASFDCVTVAFGVRNFEHLEKGLSEIARVLKPDGQVLILEFGQVKGLLRVPYELYSAHFIPYIGGWLTGDREAYEYLPRTAAHFPCGEKFAEVLEASGFKQVKAKSLNFGVTYLYSGRK
jgi:demethylmenaquinone methyltransferase/2-methoxy-6-polyprenyl-1,4-benzoquinol methylase